MIARTCPHCSVETPAYKYGYQRHVQSCTQNPNPTCPKCGKHFAEWKLAGHVDRCGTKTPKKAAVDSSAQPQAAHTAPAAEAKARGLSDVPEDRLTPTDRLILPLLAAPGEKPAPPTEARLKRAPRARAVKAAEPTDEPAPAQAAHAAPAATPQKGMAAAFEAGRPPPRMGAFAGFADSIKRNWVLLLVIGLFLVAIIVWRRLSRDDTPETSAQPVATPPPRPTARPPYNPALHGSLEAYRTTFGHLPTTNGGG